MRRKSIWLPLVLLIYFGIMLRFNVSIWQKSDNEIRLWLSIGFEVLVVVLLHIFLRRKELLENHRKVNETQNGRKRQPNQT